MKGFIVGQYISDGKLKNDIKITSYDVECIIRIGNTFLPVTNNLRSKAYDQVFTQYVDIPCGSCLECRLNYSRVWAERCMVEVPYHDTAYFLTLTYDDYHLPTEEVVHPDTGEIITAHSLNRRDMQLFFKKLRKHFTGHRISYFMCGEYGSETHRPHYHCILYGAPLDDLVLYRKSVEGNNYYNSDTLNKLWSNGFVVVGDVTFESCAYTARYCLKKQTGKVAREEVYIKNGLMPEFTGMSTRPAIGRAFYEDNKEKLYSNDHVSIPTAAGGRQIRPNKYYDKLYEKDEPEKFAKIKEQRLQRAEDFKEVKMAYTTKSYTDQLETELEELESKFRNLRRKEI